MTEPEDDAALVARARQGDTVAFELLVRRYSGAVYRIGLGIVGEPHTAQDVAQEAFLAAWRRLYDIRADQAFAAWLSRIAATRALTAARRHHAEVELKSTHPSRSPTNDPEQQAVAAGLRAALRRALRRLPSQQQTCWILKELQGLSYDEIAEITNTSRDAVRGRIHRARVSLAQEMRPWR